VCSQRESRNRLQQSQHTDDDDDDDQTGRRASISSRHEGGRAHLITHHAQPAGPLAAAPIEPFTAVATIISHEQQTDHIASRRVHVSAPTDIVVLRMFLLLRRNNNYSTVALVPPMSTVDVWLGKT